MKDTVLIITNSHDGAHTDTVIEKIEKRGEKVFRLNVDDVASGKIVVKLCLNENGIGFQFKNGERGLYGDEVKSVWYRRSHLPTLQISNVGQREHAEREILSFLEGLWCCLGDIVWVSSFPNIRLAHYKIYQLQIANQLGFVSPQALISNDPEQMRMFCSQHESVVFKTITHNRIVSSEKTLHVPTTLITPHHLQKLDLVRKNMADTTLSFTKDEWKAFIEGVKNGEFDV